MQIAHTTRPEELGAWRLTLEALGKPYRVESSEPAGWSIWVAPSDATAAWEALQATTVEELEHRSPSWRLQGARPHALEVESRLSLLPGGLFALGLILLAHHAGLGEQASRWMEAGANVSQLTRGGQWWRAVTALTLHADLAHLLLNCVAALLFVAFACDVWGPGLGLLFTVLSGALGNAAEAWLSAAPFTSVGASTAVFGAVGVMGGTRLFRPGTGRREGLRVMVSILILFAMFGLGGAERDPLELLFGTPRGPRVDALAHLSGLGAGLGVGAVARLVLHHKPKPWAQALAGGATVTLIAAAWAFGLRA